MSKSPRQLATSTFLETTSVFLPKGLEQRLRDILTSSEDEEVLEDVLRFVCGADSRTSGEKWDPSKQDGLRKALESHLKPSELKRRRAPEDDASSESAKRAKLDDDGPPKFILHSISTTTPVRKKVDLVVTATSLTFLSGANQSVETTVPLSVLKRAFILPTRGKTKPHWTVVILSSDVPDKDKNSAASVQVIFGLDASAAAGVSVTSGEGKKAVGKGDATLPYIQTFLSHLGLPNPVYETDAQVFKSACNKEPTAGTEAYLGAKTGTLWFFEEGILWGESKPCEFWAAEVIVDVRIISATGRQCSATVIRRDGEEGEETDGLETTFSFIDGREQTGIKEWVRTYRKLPASAKGKQIASAAAPVAAAGPMTINSLAMASDDEEDGDYEGGSETSEDEGGGNDDSGEAPGGGDSDASGEEDDGSDDDEEDEDEDEDEVEELKPEHHPLMRPGAMPKMSKAAMNMVVDMMEGQLTGGGDEVDELDE